MPLLEAQAENVFYRQKNRKLDILKVQAPNALTFEAKRMRRRSGEKILEISFGLLYHPLKFIVCKGGRKGG